MSTPSTFEIGRRAEAVAADWLQNQGFKILAQNWRTRWCEIDIIASKEYVVHFVEVKYRRTALYGSGLDYITREKTYRMTKAAAIWMYQEGLYAFARQLDVISVSGWPKIAVENYLTNVGA